METHFLCPRCLTVAYRWEHRTPAAQQRSDGGAA
jgi:hypothetical protein